MKLSEVIESGRATITCDEAFALLGISKNAGWRAVHNNELPTLRFGKRYYVAVPALLRMLGDEPSTPYTPDRPAELGADPPTQEEAPVTPGRARRLSVPHGGEGNGVASGG